MDLSQNLLARGPWEYLGRRLLNELADDLRRPFAVRMWLWVYDSSYYMHELPPPRMSLEKELLLGWG